MFEKFCLQNPFLMALLCSLFTYGLTALGAATVFFFRSVNQKILNFMLGFAGGVMIAASFFSMLKPSIELSEELLYINWLYPALGFIVGCLFVIGAIILIERVSKSDNCKNMASTKRCGLLMTVSITLHNIPEGLSVGVAFGAIALSIPGCEPIGAILLAVGIGIQNFPEGAAVSIPLRRDGTSRRKAFFYGQLSGIVEPIACILGYFLASLMKPILPFALSFSAGTMITVVASELLPESSQNKNLSSLGCGIGFVVMMILDVALS